MSKLAKPERVPVHYERLSFAPTFSLHKNITSSREQILNFWACPLPTHTSTTRVATPVPNAIYHLDQCFVLGTFGRGPYAATSHHTCHVGFRFSPSRKITFFTGLVFHRVTSRSSRHRGEKTIGYFRITQHQRETRSGTPRALLPSRVCSGITLYFTAMTLWPRCYAMKPNAFTPGGFSHLLFSLSFLHQTMA
jgi:hypothetical protein